MTQSHLMKYCGHNIHFDCYDGYLTSGMNQPTLLDSGMLVSLWRRKELTFGPGLFINKDEGEFQCPLCKAISNVLIPATPHSHALANNLLSTGPEETQTTPTALLQSLLQHASASTKWWNSPALPSDSPMDTDMNKPDAPSSAAAAPANSGFTFKSSLEAYVNRLACISDNSDAPEITSPAGLTYYLGDFVSGTIECLEVELRGTELLMQVYKHELNTCIGQIRKSPLPACNVKGNY